MKTIDVTFIDNGESEKENRKIPYEISLNIMQTHKHNNKIDSATEKM